MPPTLRIAVVTAHPPSSGSLTEYAFHFFRYLRRKPEVDELILLGDELPAGKQYMFDGPGAKVTVDPCWRFDAIDNAWRIRNAVRKHKPDAVLFNIQFASFGRGKVPASLGLSAPWLVKQLGLPTIVLLHNIMETVDLKNAGFGGNKLMESAIRMFGNAATRMLLSADMVALTIPKYVEILRTKYGVDNALLAPHGSFDESPPPSLELPPGPLQIMTFGKFGTYKRVERLIEAFSLMQSSARPKLELVIAGTDSPNAAGYLESMRQRYCDVENVRFTGYVPEEDVRRIFGEAAVVVFPYTSTTGSSGVLHQAGDYAKAVVLPRIGDLAELVAEEGYTGEFFDPDDANSLAHAIGKIIDYPEHRKQMGLRNYRAARGLPMDEVVDWYLLHFERLIGERNRSQPLPA